MKDSELVKYLRTKSQNAFKELYYQYYKLVYYQAFIVLNNKEDAEDVSQTTFIKFWNNIDDLKDDTKINQLLSKMAKNTAIDLYRQKVAKNTIANNELIESIPSSNEDSLDLRLTLNDCLEPIEARITILRINFDYSFRDISEELNLPIGVVQAKYYKSIEKLKKYYREAK